MRTAGRASAAIDRAAEAIESARRAVPYDLEDKVQVERALKRWLSPRTWAGRSRFARLFRAPNMN